MISADFAKDFQNPFASIILSILESGEGTSDCERPFGLIDSPFDVRRKFHFLTEK